VAALQTVILQLAEAGRTVVERGLVLASGGNLSARLDDGTFVVTASGTWLDRLTDEDFSVIDTEGSVVAGNPRPSVEWKLHHHTYAARRDVTAVVHLHPQHVLLVDMLGHPIRCTTLDHAFYLGSVARVPFRPAGSEEIAALASEAVSDGTNAVVLAHHGCSALGDSVPMALRRAMNLEEAATMTYRLLLAGDTDSDFPEEYRGRIISV
jgi:Ribulose-5-phosphate 4-epimerase and related epimerases and aldolases